MAIVSVYNGCTYDVSITSEEQKILTICTKHKLVEEKIINGTISLRTDYGVLSIFCRDSEDRKIMRVVSAKEMCIIRARE